MRLKALTLLALLVVMLVTGCGIPGETKKSAQQVPTQIEEASQQVDRLVTNYQQLKKSEEYQEFLSIYDKRENWETNFTKAKAKLADAKKVLEAEINPILKENDKEKTSALQLQIRRVQTILQEATNLAKQTGARINFLREAQKNAPMMMTKASEQATKARETFTGLQAAVVKQQEKYPNRKDDIEARFAPTRAAFSEMEEALESATQQFAGHETGECDYAIFGDACGLIGNNSNTIATNNTKLREVIGQLDRSYSKTLVDMKADFYIQVGRTSWDDYSDWNTDKDYIYPAVMVTMEAYEYFAKLGEATLATQGLGWSSWNEVAVKIDGNYWNMLKVNSGQGWPSGHDEAEYWINDDPVKYYHKYIVVEGGQQRETDWEEVTEAVFEANEDNLGMDIVSKPVGMFENETLKQAAPAGMAFVGNSEYGQWKKDPDTGDSFWEFYGKYHFYSTLFCGPGHGYYRSEYDTWDRDYRRTRTSYYGPKDSDRYGSWSNSTQTRYTKAHAMGSRGIVKTYSSSGGSGGSIRNAGSSVRGRGPGGGGK